MQAPHKLNDATHQTRTRHAPDTHQLKEKKDKYETIKKKTHLNVSVLKMFQVKRFHHEFAALSLIFAFDQRADIA